MHLPNTTISAPDVELLDHKGPFLSFARSAVDAMFGFLWYAAVCFLGLFATNNNNALVYAQNDGEYLLGLGIGDITGPVVETNMMGYADLSQTDTGLHMRQRSRAFIVAESDSPDDRILFINADIGMGDQGVRRTILSELDTLYDGLYTPTNVAFVGTHSHSGVGGFLENLLPQITALGYVNETAAAIVSGSLLAVQRAHDSLEPGALTFGVTEILDANINRSPSAYLANPEEERAKYTYDQDKNMTLLNFGEGRGFLSFFAVHGTSIHQNNTLVSTDNKGMAAYLYESSVEPNAMPGNTTFVAGFTQSNVGDTSPNTLGAYCESPGKDYDGEQCDFEHSTCGDTVADCHGRGPGFNSASLYGEPEGYGWESNRIIGQKQFEGAKAILDAGNGAAVTGGVRSVHAYVDMSQHTFTLSNGTEVKTCPPAMGYGFAGGTTDGPGAFDFVQGDNTTDPQNPFWEVVKGAVNPYPTQEQIDCQAPKPILLNTGYAHTPYEWSPATVNVQILRVGNFVMLIMPGEFTTMAGRRIREAVRDSLIAEGVASDPTVVLAGPANTYSHYVTTREEYGVQRYEGGSTIYGQYTLEAYIDKYTSLVPYLADAPPSGTPASDAAPAEQTSKAISLRTGVVFDGTPIGKRFGDVTTDVNSSYAVGDIVQVQFVGANPRNNLRLEETFLYVEQQDGEEWTAVRSDSHPTTRFEWVRDSTILGTSTVTISWKIEDGTAAGDYRIRYFGDSKAAVTGTISAFEGVSGVFSVA